MRTLLRRERLNGLHLYNNAPFPLPHIHRCSRLWIRYGYDILLSEYDLIGYTILYILIYDLIYVSLLFGTML